MYNWNEYVETILDKGSNLINKSDVESFKEWMQVRSVLGKMWRFDMWIYLFYVWRKINKQHKDQLIIIAGDEGMGKSKLGIMINWTLNLNKFTLKHFIYSHNQIYKKFAESSIGDCFQVDEAELLVYSKEQMSGEQIDFIKALQQIRTLHLNVTLCLPNYWDVNQDIRFRRASAVIWVFYSSMKKKQISFRIINLKINSRHAVGVLTEAYKQKKFNLMYARLPLSEAWISDCYEKWPFFSYDDYQDLFKRKGVKDHMFELDKKYNEGLSKDELGKYISVSQACKLCGLNDDTIRRLIKKRELSGFKINKKYMILRESFENYLEKQGFTAKSEAKYVIISEEQQKSEPKTQKNIQVQKISEPNTNLSEPKVKT